MAVSCPVCGKVFKGQGIGSHSKRCGVTMEQLFWIKVDKEWENGCWQWTASLKEKGYGQFLYDNKMHRAHRLAWTLSGRELPPKGLELGHSCDNRRCVNPDHLRPMTHDENMAEMAARKRSAWGTRSGKASMTEATARAIRNEYKLYSPRKSNLRELCAKYGVSESAATQIACGKSWRNLE